MKEKEERKEGRKEKRKRSSVTALFEKQHDVNQPENVGYDVTHLTQPQFRPSTLIHMEIPICFISNLAPRRDVTGQPPPSPIMTSQPRPLVYRHASSSVGVIGDVTNVLVKAALYHSSTVFCFDHCDWLRPKVGNSPRG